MSPVAMFYLMVIVLVAIMGFLFFVLVSESKHKEADDDRMS